MSLHPSNKLFLAQADSSCPLLLKSGIRKHLNNECRETASVKPFVVGLRETFFSVAGAGCVLSIK